MVDDAISQSVDDNLRPSLFLCIRSPPQDTTPHCRKPGRAREEGSCCQQLPSPTRTFIHVLSFAVMRQLGSQTEHVPHLSCMTTRRRGGGGSWTLTLRVER